MSAKKASENLVSSMRKAIARQPVFSAPSNPIRLTSTDTALGQRVRVDFGGAGSAERGGLHAHVRGIFIAGKATLTTSNVTNSAVTARNVRRSVFKNFSLVDGDGHYHFKGLDCGSLLDDVFARTGSVIYIDSAQHGVQASGGLATITDDGLAANIGAAQANSVNCSVYIPFSSPRPRGREHNQFAGLISLAALQDRSDAFSFDMGPATMIGSPTNVVLTNVKNFNGDLGLDIILDLVWLPGICVDTPWVLDHYQDKQKSNTLLYRDSFHEYCVMRYKDDDAIGGTGTYTNLQGPASHDGVTLTVGGEVVFAGLTRTDLYVRELFRQGADWMSAQARQNGAQSLPIVASGKLQWMTLVPYLGRAHAAAGPIVIDAVTRDADFAMYLHRSFSAHESRPNRLHKHARAAGIDNGVMVTTNAAGKEVPASQSDGLHPVFIKAHG